MVGSVVGITQPGNNTVISGEVSVRTMVWNSTPCTFKVLVNAWENATELPWQWDTTAPQFGDGWWNLTVQVMNASGYLAQDQVLVQVLNHPEQHPIYYCSSQAEITTALASIGVGARTIVITQNVTLTSTIAINGGGSYLIQGVSPGVTVDCNGNRGAFNISSAASCTIRDLSVDARDITSIGIKIIYADVPLVSLANLRIFGNGTYRGDGIHIASTHAWITICYLSDLYSGIYLSDTSYAVHVSGNTVSGCYTNLHLGGDEYACQNNLVTSGLTGMYVTGANHTIANNILQEHLEYGIRAGGKNSTYTGNTITGIRDLRHYDVYGITVESSGNVFTGNVANSHHALSGGTGYGIYIFSWADETVVVGNSFLYNDVNFSNDSSITIA